MTTIVGIKCLDGLVMASDLLTTDEDGIREERKKLYFTDIIVIGHTGLASRGIYDGIPELLNKLLSYYSIEELLQKDLFAKATLYFNYSMKKLNPSVHRVSDELSILSHLAYMIGVYNNDGFHLFGDQGFGEKLEPVRVAVFSSPCDYSNFLSATKNVNCSQALELAINVIRTNNQRYPDLCSGLEAVQLTKNGVERVAYEPISQ